MVKGEEFKIANRSTIKENNLYTDEKIKILQKDFTILIENRLKVLDNMPPLNTFIK